MRILSNPISQLNKSWPKSQYTIITVTPESMMFLELSISFCHSRNTQPKYSLSRAEESILVTKDGVFSLELQF